MDELPWPFVGSRVLAAKAIPERAMRRWYQPVYPDVYVPRGVELTAAQRASAAWLWGRGRAIVAGQSAAALLGAKWVDRLKPAELVCDNCHPPPLIVVHRDMLLPDEVTDINGIPLTTPERTAFDIGRRTSRLAAIQRLDALANATEFKIADVDALIANHKGARGLASLRRLLPLVDAGAESPQESRTRIVLVDAGLPQPETQIRVFDPYGDFVARIDMGYRELLVGVEYDGAQHWTDPAQRANDIDRHAELKALGWIIIRVSNELLRLRPATVVSRVEEALRSRGWAPSVNLTTVRRRVA
jgi:hypothetical protein